MDILVGSYVNGMAEPGQVMHIQSNVLLNAAENSWPSTGGVVLQVLAETLPPVAVLSSPPVVAECDVARIDGVSSYGDGGRTLRYEWNVTVEPSLDENGVPIFSCTDDTVFSQGLSTCVDLYPVAYGQSCADLVASGKSCSSDLCPTCIHKHWCDNYCNYCAFHDSAEDTCESAVSWLKTIPYISEAWGCGDNTACVCGANLFGWHYNLPEDGTIAPRCRRYCGLCTNLTDTLNLTTLHVQSLLVGPQPTISATDMIGSLEYTFSLSVSNFLSNFLNFTAAPYGLNTFSGDQFSTGGMQGLQSSVVQATVVKSLSPHPQVYVTGPSRVHTQKSQPLRLFSKVFMSTCWTGSQAMQYSWVARVTTDKHGCSSLYGQDDRSVFVECGGHCVPSTECRMPDLSKYHVSQGTHLNKDLYIASDMLPAGVTVVFTLSASLASNNSIQSQATVSVVVDHSELKAMITGGDRSVSETKPFVLDAGSSFDPDNTALRPSDFQFQWQCAQLTSSNECSGSPEFIAALSTNASRLALNGNFFSAAQSLCFTVIVSVQKPADSSLGLLYSSPNETSGFLLGKVATARVIVTIVRGLVATVMIQRIDPWAFQIGVDPFHEVTLQGSVNLSHFMQPVDDASVTLGSLVTRWRLMQGDLEGMSVDGFAADVGGHPRLTLPSGSLAPGQLYTFRLLAIANYSSNASGVDQSTITAGYSDYNFE